MSKSQAKLIIIDGNALIHRSFHALPPTLRTKKGQLVNAVYGFTAFLLKSLNEFRPEYVILTLDKAGPTFRHETYADYKATRVKAPDELYEQIPLVKKVATAFNVPIFELSGYEADDLIGSICEQTKADKKLQKIIITGDLDTLQLVDEKTKVYTMSRGLSDSVFYGDEEVKGRYGFRPDQLIDYKALRGDPSDNIPGVRGIGEKTAAELIINFGSLDKIYQAVKRPHPQIKARTAELLLANRDNAYLSRELATINRQAPLKISLEEAKFPAFRLETVLNLFQELEFKSLLIKVKELRDRSNNGRKASRSESKIEPNASPNSKQSNRQIAASDKTDNDENKFARNQKNFNYQLIDKPKKFALFLKKLKSQKSFALDTETDGLDPLKARLIGLSFSWEKGEAYFIPANKQRLDALQPILENPKIKKCGHNIKFDWRVLKKAGLKLSGIDFDTMIASYLLNPASRQHNLDSLAFTELGFEKINKLDLAASQPEQLTLNFGALDLEKLSLYACEDADFTCRLAKILNPKIKKSGLSAVLKKIELPLIPILGTMEDNGIKTEARVLNKLEKEAAAKLQSLEKSIWHLAGEKFNINSTKQLKEILFERLAIPTDNIKKTKTGFSTAEDELQKMRGQHPIIPLLQDYRELSKLSNTYLQALPKIINPATGRVHTSFNQTIVATGRLSSSDPNLQNIPIKTSEGQKVRSAFRAEDGWQLVAFDYSQIELRLAAHMSDDKKMTAAFQAGQDIHVATAAAINGVKLSEVSPKMRREAKAINFGILYGQGPHGLSQGANIPYYAAQKFIEKYFQTYPGIKKMMENSIASAQKNSYVATLLGRRRWLPEINSAIPAVRKAAERMAINTPLQGTAADIIKLAMIKIADLIADREKEIKMLLQVHDELIFEIKQDKIENYSGKIKEIMENAFKLKVPVVVEQKTGSTWANLE